MRKIVIGGIATVLGASVMLATGAFAGSPNNNGAQKATLHNQTQASNGNCQSGGAGDVGWAIVNGPGQPGAIKFINGEVHLVDPTAPNETFQIWLGSNTGNGDMCTMTTDTVTTNAEGIGNGHLSNDAGTAGMHFVALYTDPMDGSMPMEKYASDEVTIN